MTTQHNQLHGRKFRGTLLGKKYGSNEPFQKLGNVVEFSTKTEVEKDELISTAREDYGQAIDVETKPKPSEVTLKFNSFDKHALARAMMGESVDLTAKVVSFSDVVGTVAKNGWVKLSHDDIDVANFTVKNKEGQKIAESEYDVNVRLGMIRFKAESTVTEGDNFTYTGKTKGTAGYQIEASSLQSLALELYLDGVDIITGKDGKLHIPHVVLSSDGDINWFTDDWWENGLTGTIVKDDGKYPMLYTESV